MENIILFRFHKDFESCKNRVEILKYFNPTVPIYALYGGPKENFAKAQDSLGNLVIDMQMSTNQDPEYKWFHPDQTLKEWYLTYGKNLDFKYLYDYESDILALAPLAELYPKIDDKTISLSGVEKLDDVENTWSWTSEPGHKENFAKLCSFMKDTYGVARPTQVSLGPGPYLSKTFLHDFSNSNQPANLIDPVISEIIYPYYAECLGYQIVNSGLHPTWFDEESCTKYFNCEDISIKKEVIMDEAYNPLGRRAFHPVKYIVTLDEIRFWLSAK